MFQSNFHLAADYNAQLEIVKWVFVNYFTLWLMHGSDVESTLHMTADHENDDHEG